MHNIQFHNFEEAGKQVIEYLHEHLGFGLWMITRVEGENWIVLQAENEKYNRARRISMPVIFFNQLKEQRCLKIFF